LVTVQSFSGLNFEDERSNLPRVLPLAERRDQRVDRHFCGCNRSETEGLAPAFLSVLVCSEPAQKINA
jgi:hypothetical protein